MSDLKINNITPLFGNIKVGNTNVKKIYQGDVLVWPPNFDPPYFTTPTDRAEVYNPPAVNVGDNFRYSVRAVSDALPNSSLIITSDNLPEGFTITSTTVDPLTGNAIATISGIVGEGGYSFNLKVTDEQGLFSLQEVVLNGVIPDIGSFFIFYFDSSGSMASTLPDLQRDLQGTNANDPTTLRYYLQKFFAQPGDDGSDRYNAQVEIKQDGSENWAYMLNNQNDFLNDGSYENASSISIQVFMDEAGSVLASAGNYYLYSGDWIAGNGYSKNFPGSGTGSSNFVSTVNTVTNTDKNIKINQTNLYQVTKDIIAGSPESYVNPSEDIYDRETNPNGHWIVRSRSQDGVPSGLVLFASESTSLMTQVSSLKNNIKKSNVKYSGVLYCVEGNNSANALAQSFYDAINNVPESRFYRDNNSLVDYKNTIIFGNPKDQSNRYGIEYIKDGGTQPGYYTQLVLNSLKELGYVGIRPYEG